MTDADQKRSSTLLRTNAERSLKLRERERLIEHKNVLIHLIEEGISCKSIQEFISWQRKAEFICRNELENAR